MNKLGKKRKIIAIFLCCCFLSHCISYKRVAVESPTSLNMDYEGIELHYGDQTISLINITLTDTEVKGILNPDLVYYKKKKNQQMDGSFRIDTVIVKKSRTVHMYLNIPIDSLGSIGDTVALSINNIETIEVFEKEKGKSLVYTIGATVFPAAAVAGIMVILIALLKTSCPFIYINNGITYEFVGEIFSGATFHQIERHDYLRLPSMNPPDDYFNLLVTNEVNEIQHINLLELITYEHEADQYVLVDKYGKGQLITEPREPIKAIGVHGQNVLNEITKKDNLFYSSCDSNSFSKSAVEQLILVFENPQYYKSGSLIIRAKNSTWLDYSYMRFHDQLGKYYGKWYSKQQEVSADEINNWAFNQKIPLIASVENNGEWKYQDHFNIAGPMAMKDDILRLDLTGVGSDQVRIKLETGFMFWEIDYIAMDYSDEPLPDPLFVSAETAEDQSENNILQSILSDDDRYYVQDQIGNEAFINFLAPPNNADLERTIILHSKGYYDLLLDPPSFRPRLSELKKLEGPLQFTRFSKEYYHKIYDDGNKID